MNILILTVGTRGDVQPFVALGEGLQAAGHRVTLATGQGFGGLVERWGLRYAPLRADYLELAQSTEGKAAMAGKGRLSALKQVMPMLRRVLDDAWAAAPGAGLVIYHPKALAGYHIAEKLGVPAILSVPLPLYSPTRAFASPILPGAPDLGPALNRLSHRLLVWLTVAPYRGLINTWRREVLELPPAGAETVLNGRPVLRLYPYSRHVLPVPPDWDENTVVTGYWFLKPDPTWQVPAELGAFLESGPAPVYVGFGSMPALDAARVTATVLEAVQGAGVRAVLATGWGGMAQRDLPSSVYMLESAPHDWLFPHTRAVVHHGGAGTTAAGLRAGRPTVVCPLAGDQPFWGKRVQALGVGPRPLPLKKLSAEALARAIREAVTGGTMRSRAEALGKAIRGEDGVARAVEAIERYAAGAACMQAGQGSARTRTPREGVGPG